MKVGIGIPNGGFAPRVQDPVSLAVVAESMGFDSV